MNTRWNLIKLGETWLGEDEVGVQLEGYNIYKTYRRKTRNDGVFVFAKEELGDVYRLSLDFMYNNNNVTYLLCTGLMTVGFNLASLIDSSGPFVVDDNGYTVDSVFTIRTVTEQDLYKCVSSLRGGSFLGAIAFLLPFLKTTFSCFVKVCYTLLRVPYVPGGFPMLSRLLK
ncbi:hypothetical protein J6590_054211 [Homalodisca vitripennis]|nr:hypothetical protein J6590_054211 [Homalodisca vitripennis]